jgi:hypothetical protein
MVSAWVIIKRSCRLVWSRKGLFSGVVAIYALLNLALVYGLASANTLHNLQDSTRQLFHGHGAALGSSLSNVVALAASAGTGSSPGSAVWQFALLIIASLAIIWALRQAQNHNRMRVRDAYYASTYPLVPFVLVLFLISLELLPLALTGGLYSIVMTNQIASHVIEKILWTGLFAGGAVLSLYLICSSIMALYIVTLPDMTPIKAIRSANDLVRGRRLLVLRKILVLPVILVIATLLILLPAIAASSGLTVAVFFLLNLIGLLAIHAYLYTLYRDLLDE